MAALIQSKPIKYTTYKNVALPLATGVKVYVGSKVAVDSSAHYLKPAASGNANLVPVGFAQDFYDNTSGTAAVNVLVRLDREVEVAWYDNATGGNAVTSPAAGNSLFSTVYMLDDHTVTTSAGGNSTLGRVWDVNSTYGVAVQNTQL